jgi:hypothetical protein
MLDELEVPEEPQENIHVAKLLGYESKLHSDNQTVSLSESSGDKLTSTKIKELLEFLSAELPGKPIRVAWNLDEFVAPILRLLGKEACLQIKDHNKLSLGRAYGIPASIFYVPGKVFSISDQQYNVNFYGIDQYFPDWDYPGNIDQVAGFGNMVIDALKKMHLDTKKLTSPVAIYEDAILKHCQIPTVAEVREKNWEVFDYALKCTGRLWISAYQLGHWDEEKCFDYDLRSAFPSVHSQLYSTDEKFCSYEKSDHWIETAHMGFCKGKITVDHPIAPIFYQSEDGLINPVGTWEGYLSTDEVRFLQKWKLGKFELIDGWFLTVTAPMQPMLNITNRLYSYRGTDPIVDLLSKRMLAGAYGKSLEQHEDGKLGKYYNPIWGALIPIRTNLKLAEFIYKKKLEENVIHIAVDGVLTDRFVGEPKLAGMGNWKLSGIGPAYVISSGLVFHGNKKPKGINYSKLKDLIKVHPNQSYYEEAMKRPVTMKEALQLGSSDIGKMKTYRSSIDLATVRHDRQFDSLPKTGKELSNNVYHSKPYKIED